MSEYTPPSIDDEMPFGKHRGVSYRDAARRDPSYMGWAARTIGGVKGQLCAEALAEFLGIRDDGMTA